MARRGPAPAPGEIIERRPIGSSKSGLWGLDDRGQWWCYPKGFGAARKRAEMVSCQRCETPFLRPVTRSKHHLGIFCSRTCANAAVKDGRHRRGEKHWNWKGGRHIRKRDGYITLHVEDPKTGKRKWQLEHRLIMAKHLGRDLYPHETVHHKNGDRADNRLENLELRVGRHGKGASEAHCRTCTCFAHG